MPLQLGPKPRAIGSLAYARPPIHRFAHAEAFLRQQPPLELANLRIVVGDQDSSGGPGSDSSDMPDATGHRRCQR
jgi:hypothetical protein